MHESVKRPRLFAAILAATWVFVPVSAVAQDYEIWALDQGTNKLHVYGSNLEVVGVVDLGAAGVRTPHMIDFTSDGSHAFVSSTASGDVTVIRGADREIVARLATGPGTHASTVKPDDSAVIAAVIGSADVKRDGKLVEIVIGANESFEIGRELVIAEDPLFEENQARFNEVAAICLDFSADGRHAYVTLGPGLADGGLVVLDTDSFSLVSVFPPDQLKVNCGTALSVDGRSMFVNGGGADVGTWHVIDTGTREVVHEDSSRGNDAHGVFPTPDGREVWMVNRVTDNGIIIDPSTFAVVEEIAGFGDAPDIIAMSPDSRFAFISLRGPKPVSAAHVAVGTTPGFAVVDIAERRLVNTVRPDPDNEASDFHGIGVRVIP